MCEKLLSKPNAGHKPLRPFRFSTQFFINMLVCCFKAIGQLESHDYDIIKNWIDRLELAHAPSNLLFLQKKLNSNHEKRLSRKVKFRSHRS